MPINYTPRHYARLDKSLTQRIFAGRPLIGLFVALVFCTPSFAFSGFVSQHLDQPAPIATAAPSVQSLGISIAQDAKLTASDSRNGDELGTNLVVSADGSTAVASSRNYAAGFGESAVYVYTRPASGWANRVQTARLTASPAAFPKNLGASLAISADGSTIVASAIGPVGNTLVAAVYVFTRPASGWANSTETARFSDFEESSLAQVSISADGNIVAAGVWPNKTVYVYSKTPTGWNSSIQPARLSSADAFQPNESRLSADGNSLAVLGTLSSAATAEYLVYVYVRPPSGWANLQPTAKLSVSAPVRLNHIAVSDDGQTIVAGADANLYLFAQPNIGWSSTSETAKLTLTWATSDSEIQEPPISQDGKTIIVAEQHGHSRESAVYVFERPATGWVSSPETARLIMTSVANFFFASIAISSDGGTIIAGAEPYAPVCEFGCDASQLRFRGWPHGTVYIYFRPETGWSSKSQDLEMIASDASWIFGSPFGFGARVAVSADGNTIFASALDLGLLGPGGLYVRALPGVLLTSKPPPSPAIVGASYQHTFTARSAGQAAFSVVGGALPPGLSIDTASGTLSGIPSAPGIYNFTLGVRDSSNHSTTENVSLAIVTEIKSIVRTPLVDHFVSVYTP